MLAPCSIKKIHKGIIIYKEYLNEDNGLVLHHGLEANFEAQHWPYPYLPVKWVLDGSLMWIFALN